MGTPLSIVLYGADDDPIKEYTRSIIPWGILKKSIALTRAIGKKDVAEADVDAIAGLVVEAFGNQFTIQELDAGADIGEMLTVLQSIVARAGELVNANPTVTPSRTKRRS